MLQLVSIMGVGVVVKGIVIGAGGFGFDSRAGQIGRSVAYGSDIAMFLEELCCPDAKPPLVTRRGLIKQV